MSCRPAPGAVPRCWCWERDPGLSVDRPRICSSQARSKHAQCVLKRRHRGSFSVFSNENVELATAVGGREFHPVPSAPRLVRPAVGEW
jgi:hypothetical protein